MTQVGVPILYEDESVLVVNKPAGLLVHPTEHNPGAPSLTKMFADKLAQSDKLRPGIVHRLDKDTSGVIIMAKTMPALQMLQAQFKNHTVKKLYEALVWGHLDNPKARLELPIARSRRQPNKMMVHQSGKPAASQYNVLGEYGSYSLVEVQIFTGRTHQIRAQFAHLGHPVVGDTMYSKRARPEGLTRQFLHAKLLSLDLPSGRHKEFSATLPKDLKEFLHHNG